MAAVDERGSGDSQRGSASAGSTGDEVRADAAVARQGLRAAGGARRVMVPRSDARQREAERFRVLSRARAVVRFKITRPAVPGALCAPLKLSVEEVLTGPTRPTCPAPLDVRHGGSS
jgi:hypothetical protein